MSLRSWWRSLKTADDLIDRMTEIEDEWREIQLDWADKVSQFDRLLRRLTLRDNRRIEASPEPNPIEIVRPDGTHTPKTALREPARAAGLVSSSCTRRALNASPSGGGMLPTPRRSVVRFHACVDSSKRIGRLLICSVWAAALVVAAVSVAVIRAAASELWYAWTTDSLE